MINQSEKQAELKLAARSPPDILCHWRPSEIIGLLIFFLHETAFTSVFLPLLIIQLSVKIPRAKQ